MTVGPDKERLASALRGRYRLDRELGAGGMATVFLATDLKHDRRVALKVLRPALSVTVGPERFLAEIRTTANLRHPHVLPLFDSGEADGLLYYVMPYVEGESLEDRLAREGRLPVDEALAIAREVADALDHAHGRGIVHRDIKPANILLGDGGALVADFGIALALASAGSERLTRTGLTPGTPAYMSPEQLAGEGTLDGRTLHIPGDVAFEIGETSVLFLNERDGAWYLSAMEQSVYALVPSIDGPSLERELSGDYYVRDDQGALVPVDDVSFPSTTVRDLALLLKGLDR